MEKIVKAYNIAVLAITAAAVLFVGIFTVPRLFSIRPFVVQSGSMEPAIPTGSVVFVNEKDKDIKIGDVITFGLSTGVDHRDNKEKGVYVTHRVNKLFKSENLIQTKGDANMTPDGYLSMDAVVGKAFLRIPRVGFLLNHLQQSHGYVTLTILVCVLNSSSMLLGGIVKSQHSGSHAVHIKKKGKEAHKVRKGRKANK